MRAPSPIQYLFGNPISSLALMLGALFLAFRWTQGEVSGWLTLGAVVAASYAAKASDTVNRYGSWKRQWDRMGGERTGIRLPRIPGLRIAFGIGAWLFLAVLVIGSADDPAMGWAVVCFWLATAIMVVVGLYRLIRRSLGRPRGRNEAVQVCLGKPMQSATVAQATASLPTYCGTLLRA